MVLSSRPPEEPLAASQDVETFVVPMIGHVDGPVVYDQDPPVGGLHADVWQNCGFYDEPVPAEQGVHSLEHGVVWITYRPSLPADQIAVLRRLAASRANVLVSPWPRDLPSPVVVSVWGRQRRLSSASDPGLADFMARFGRGEDAPEPGGPCTGGAGTPS